MSSSLRSRSSEGAHAAKLNTVLYHFYAKTAAVAHESRKGVAPVPVKANKWVRGKQLWADPVLAEPARHGAASRVPAAMEVTERGTCAADVHRCASAHISSGARSSRRGLRAQRQHDPRGGVRRRAHPLDSLRALDRGYAVRSEQLTRPMRHDTRLPAVYKQAIVHFRTLYALARVLPAYALCRSIADGRSPAPLAVDVEVQHASPEPLGVHQTWSLEGLPTPIGTLQCHVHYRACTELRVERRGKAAPCADTALTIPPPMPTPAPSLASTTSKPSHAPSRCTAPALLATRRRSGELASGVHRQDVLAERATASPLLHRMWPASEMHTLHSMFDDSPHSDPFPHAHYAAEHASREGLRTLFQSYAPARPPMGVSPGSLYSLRAAQPGTFDAHMRRLAETSPSTSLPEGTQPVRIQRYARQPSYRQREYSRSLGGADDASGSARSWSQRMEQRRMMERGSGRDSIGSFPSSQLSPNGSRLFADAAPSQAPAFALAKPTRSAPNDDLMELVHMLDTSPALHEVEQRSTGRSLARSPSPLPSMPYRMRGAPAENIDDVLARLADSVQFPAMDERFGVREQRATPLPIRIQARGTDHDAVHTLDLSFDEDTLLAARTPYM